MREMGGEPSTTGGEKTIIVSVMTELVLSLQREIVPELQK